MERQFKSLKNSGGDINVKWDGEPFDIEGYYTSITENTGSKQNSTIYKLKKEDGNELIFWGSAVLDDQMTKVELGDYIMIKYLGKAKSKAGSLYHIFEVFVDESVGNVQKTNSESQQVVTKEPVASAKKQVAKAVSDDPFGGEDDLPF